MKSDWRLTLEPKMLSSNASDSLKDGIRYNPAVLSGTLAWAHAGGALPRTTAETIAAASTLTIIRGFDACNTRGPCGCTQFLRRWNPPRPEYDGKPAYWAGAAVFLTRTGWIQRILSKKLVA